MNKRSETDNELAYFQREKKIPGLNLQRKKTRVP
jgi:hypothetical protein